MKNKQLFAPLIFSTCVLSTQASAELDAKFAGALICADQDIVTVMACNLGGKSAVNFYAIGDDLVSIDESSLQLTKLMIGKKDMLKDQLDRPNYELGSFSDIKENGKVAEWDIIVKSGLEKLEGGISMKGSLTAFVGSGMQVEKSELFDPKNHQDIQIGPVRLKANATDKQDSTDFINSLKEEGALSASQIDLFEEMLVSGVVTQDKSLLELEADVTEAYPNIDMETKRALGPAIMKYTNASIMNMTDDENQFAFKIEADDNAVEKIELVNAKGESIESQGVFTTNGVKQYLFEKTEDSKVRLVVSYQKDLKPVQINVDI